MEKISKENNFSEWYSQLITKSELADYTKVSGCIVFRPVAWAIWEKIRDEVDKRGVSVEFKEIHDKLLGHFGADVILGFTEAGKEINQIDRRIKKMLEGIDHSIVCGDFVITAKPVERKAYTVEAGTSIRRTIEYVGEGAK